MLGEQPATLPALPRVAYSMFLSEHLELLLLSFVQMAPSLPHWRHLT